MKYLSVVFFMSITGCHQTNDEVIKERDKCLKAGMDYSTHVLSLKIVCTKPSKDYK